MDPGDQARDFAKTIYDLSEEAYMAHSIHAVKQYIRERKGNRSENYLMIVKRVEGFSLYARKKSTAKVWSTKAIIIVDKALGREQTRMCIAHELYHVLLSMEKFFQTAVLDFEQIPRNRHTEEVCDIFATRLCSLHDNFYSDYNRVREFCLFANFPQSSGPSVSREVLGLPDKYGSR